MKKLVDDVSVNTTGSVEVAYNHDGGPGVLLASATAWGGAKVSIMVGDGTTWYPLLVNGTALEISANGAYALPMLPAGMAIGAKVSSCGESTSAINVELF